MMLLIKNKTLLLKNVYNIELHNNLSDLIHEIIILISRIRLY